MHMSDSPSLWKSGGKAFLSMAVIGAAAVAEEALKRYGSNPGVFDWGRAERVGLSSLPNVDEKSGGAGERKTGQEEGNQRVWQSIREVMLDHRSSSRATPFKEVEELDGTGVVRMNLDIMRRLSNSFESMMGLESPSAWRGLTRLGGSWYIGKLLGMMGGRILGQYDPVLSFNPDDNSITPRMMIAVNNLMARAKGFGLAPEVMRELVLAHEMTHAWQFGTHPWLREHITGLLREIVPVKTDPSGKPAPQLNIAAKIDAIRQVQAIMAVIEGHGDWVMKKIGEREERTRQVLPIILRHAAVDQDWWQRLLALLTGMSGKLKQYHQGRDFLEAVEGMGGVEAITWLWNGPEWMPRMNELNKPEAWYKRVLALRHD